MKKNDGVIVGCDEQQEWLLPWWWLHYRMHNQLPVTFVNFGNMSKEAVAWCTKRGQLKSLVDSDLIMSQKEEIDPHLLDVWETSHSTHDLWKTRPSWFKKPFSMLLSPYERTLWLDLDCQVRFSLTPIFDFCENTNGIALTIEPTIFHEIGVLQGIYHQNEKIYNSGVIVYRKNNQIIKEWATQALTHNQFFMGDQQLLSRIIHIKKLNIEPLPEIYNWRLDFGEMNPQAVILHWLGSLKDKIKEQIQALTIYFHMDLTLKR